MIQELHTRTNRHKVPLFALATHDNTFVQAADPSILQTEAINSKQVSQVSRVSSSVGDIPMAQTSSNAKRTLKTPRNHLSLHPLLVYNDFLHNFCLKSLNTLRRYTIACPMRLIWSFGAGHYASLCIPGWSRRATSSLCSTQLCTSGAWTDLLNGLQNLEPQNSMLSYAFKPPLHVQPNQTAILVIFGVSFGDKDKLKWH